MRSARCRSAARWSPPSASGWTSKRPSAGSPAKRVPHQATTGRLSFKDGSLSCLRTSLMTPDELRALVRTIPDHPKPGILFRDVTTLLLHAEGFAAAIDALASSVPAKPELVAGMEARGFVVATALALK